MPHLPVASARRSPTRRGQPTTADILKPSNTQQKHAVTRASDSGSISASLRSPTFQFHRKVSTLSAIAVFVLLAANVLVVRASLTMSGTAVTDDSALNLTGVGTSTVDVGSGTLQLQTMNGGPITTGAGLFTTGGSLASKGPTPWIDVRSYGAKCNATYNVTTQAITGTDDTTAIQNAINALPTLGGVVYIPGHCRFTTALTVSSSYATILGIPGWQHSNSQDTAAALIFDSTTSTGVSVSGPGFTMQDLGLFTKNGANGISLTGGTAFFKHDKIFNINGGCPGCLPGSTSGKGIDIPSVGSGYVFYDTQIAGYQYGLDDEAGNSLSLVAGNQFMANGINLRLGNNSNAIAKAYIAGNGTFQDAGCSGCSGFTPGNIDIIAGTDIVIDGNYFENGASSQNGFNVRVGSGTYTPSSIRFSNNYMACNSNASATAVILTLADGWNESQNTFSGCPGTIISNATSGTADLYFSDDYFLSSSGHTYLTSYHGIVQSDEQNNGLFGIGTRAPVYSLDVAQTYAPTSDVGTKGARVLLTANPPAAGASTYTGILGQSWNSGQTANGSYTLQGVQGFAQAIANTNLSSLQGVYGFSNVNSTGDVTNAYGVYGESLQQTGTLLHNGYGIYGYAHGAAITNIGGYFTASGGTNNYSLITGSGNVGIGTSSPAAILQAVDSTNDSSTIRVGASGKHACLEMGASSGTVGATIYVYFDSNAAIYATTSKPNFCQ